MMTPKDFARVARQNGLTTRQLVKLSMIQAEIYHSIRHDGAPNEPRTRIFLAPQRRPGGMRPITALAAAGLIDIAPDRTVGVTDAGWSIPCNAGASVFVFGCSDADIIAHAPQPPLTRFGPQYPPLEEIRR